MAFTKKGGEHVAAESTTEAPVAESTKARKSTTKARTPLTIAAIIGGGVLALGAAFGVGLVAGHAAPGFPGGPEFAAGAGPLGGHGDRDGDHRGGPQGGQPGFPAPGANSQHGQGADTDGDFCHPGDGHTHDAQGNDVAPSDAAEGFTCQTGPAEGSTGVAPAPGATTAP